MKIIKNEKIRNELEKECNLYENALRNGFLKEAKEHEKRIRELLKKQNEIEIN